MYNKLFFIDDSEPDLSAENLNHMDNGIEQANRGISFGGSATFDSNGVLKSFTDLTSIGSGSFATGDTDIVTVYIGCDVTTINGGAFANCPNLQTVYIDNTSDNITVSIPEGVSVIYNDDEDFINVNHFLAKSIKNIANRQVDKVKVAVDLNSTSITDIPVVNLSGCTVGNAPVTGSISGTVVNFNYKVDLESIVVQFLVMRNNYTYKRSYSTTNDWSNWVLVADDLSKYLKTADLQGAILSDTPSDTTTYHSNRINTLLKEKIDTVALRGADMKTVPTYLTLAQKEGNTLALYFSELFNDDTPSDRTTFSGAKLDEMLSDKEDNSNKLTTGSPSYKEAQYPSVAYLEEHCYSKLETDTKLSELKTALDLGLYIDENGDICQKEE